jgi:hypothetical protein
MCRPDHERPIARVSRDIAITGQLKENKNDASESHSAAVVCARWKKEETKVLQGRFVKTVN